MVKDEDFPSCGVCGSKDWRVVYEGPIRDGTKQKALHSVVQNCGGCGVERLAESACKVLVDYEGETYREALGQSHNRSKYYHTHKQMLNFNLGILLEYDLLDKSFVDVGCGGGIVLDALRGISSCVVGIEPNGDFGNDLVRRDIDWFDSLEKALLKYESSFDIALSSQVIEHVLNPLEFLMDIFALLKPGGLAVISTPNLDDILMHVARASFAKHFYRTQHRWMFNQKSLSKVCQLVGFEIEEIRFVHRYNFSNMMKWVVEVPAVYVPPTAIQDKNLDALWRSWVERTGRSDNLVAILRKPS